MTEKIETRVEKHPLEEVSFFGVYAKGQTYLNILYMILLMPIGIVFFTYAVTVFSTAVGLLVTFVGIFILYFFFLSLPYLMVVQGWLMKLSTGIELPKQEITFDENRTLMQKSMDALKNKVIWKTFFYFLFFAMPLGILTFTLVVTLISVGLSITFAFLGPLIEWAVTGVTLTEWWITPAVRIILIIGCAISPFVGFPLLTAILHLNNRLAVWHGRLVVKILTR
ncbi:MAG: sensor domain-containing protein [Candidatus Heimdallarchaeota archaeon]|nr:sensor domain-containing protein [Candidatus Heimdallarchaeota archaeon]MBY8995029.1 sensor domain-containing protein [Candidatus Heimdallarchaeota archaeon]